MERRRAWSGDDANDARVGEGVEMRRPKTRAALDGVAPSGRADNVPILTENEQQLLASAMKGRITRCRHLARSPPRLDRAPAVP